MTADEKLIEVMSIGAAEARLGKGCWTRAHDSERDIWRQEAEGGLSALRAAGWLLLPPLGECPKTQDEVMSHIRGRTRLDRIRSVLSGIIGAADQAAHQRHPQSPVEMRQKEFEGVFKLLRAAGGSHE